MTKFVACNRGSDHSEIRYALLVLWMTSCFDIMEQMGQNKYVAHVASNFPGGGIGSRDGRLTPPVVNW